ncbi:hypothetical protein CH063_04436, partial [Colletotrichum higginsianum]
AIADLHTHALCVARGGDDFEATECACELYKTRNTGNKPWDSCPDCFYNPVRVCHSGNRRIGGDEFEHYCSKRCGAQGSRAN